jgi:serine phosphatase RsbU (regulator of sigma subunit)
MRGEGSQRPRGRDVPEAEEADVAAQTLARLLEAMVDAARDGVLAVSPARRVLAVNRKFFELFAMAPESVKVGDPSPALGEQQLSRVSDPEAFAAGIRWGHEHPYETQVLDVALRDGRVIEGYAAPIVDVGGRYLGRVWYLHDETERRAAEAQRSALMAQLATAQRAQRFLLDASEALARATGFSETLELLAGVAVPTLGDLCLIDVAGERGQVIRVAAEHADPTRRDLVDQLRSWPPHPDSDHPSIRAMKTGTSQWAAEMVDDYLRDTTRNADHLEVVRQLEFSGFMAVPLVADGRSLGALTLIASGSGRRFGPEDLALAEDLARRVALVIDKERRYDLERRASHALQASLLPGRAPAVAGLQAAVRYLPSTQGADLGGDFWDMTPLPGGEAVLAIGDVAGHDMSAAATMAQLRSACRALLAHVDGPGGLIDVLQSSWDQLGLERMATAAFAQLDPASGSLRLASAGHPPPLIVDEGKAWFPPLVPAPPLGAPARPAPVWEGNLPAGAAVVMFTDGLVEDRHRDVDEGTRRLAAAASTAPSMDPELLADHILASLSGTERADDVALLVVRRSS